MSIPYRRPALVVASLLLGACPVMPTGPSVMVLPGTGQSIERFRDDERACRQDAYIQIGGKTAGQAARESAVTTAAVGTAVGAVAGAAIGGNQGAAVGAGAARPRGAGIQPLLEGQPFGLVADDEVFLPHAGLSACPAANGRCRRAGARHQGLARRWRAR